MELGSEQEITIMKQNFADVIEHIEMFGDMLRQKSADNLYEQMVFHDFFKGVEEIKAEIEGFLDSVKGHEREFLLKNKWSEVCRPYVEPSVSKLKRMESFHRQSPIAQIAVGEVSGTLHSIFYQIEELMKKY